MEKHNLSSKPCDSFSDYYLPMCSPRRCPPRPASSYDVVAGSLQRQSSRIHTRYICEPRVGRLCTARHRDAQTLAIIPPISPFTQFSEHQIELEMICNDPWGPHNDHAAPVQPQLPPSRRLIILPSLEAMKMILTSESLSLTRYPMQDPGAKTGDRPWREYCRPCHMQMMRGRCLPILNNLSPTGASSIPGFQRSYKTKSPPWRRMHVLLDISSSTLTRQLQNADYHCRRRRGVLLSWSRCLTSSREVPSSVEPR